MTNTVKNETGEQVVLAVLVVIFVFVITFREGGFLKGTTATTRGNSSQRRDLSTPSSRLVGHWQSVDNDGEVFYRPIHPDLRIATYRFRNKPYGNAGPPNRFKILSEEPSGTQLVIRPYGENESLRALREIGMECWMSDKTYTIPKHGQSMTQEGTLMGDPILSVYRYVDDKTSP